MNRLLVLVLTFGAAGCDPVQMGQADYASPEVRELQSEVLSCHMDVAKVPFEHSEHCVIVGEKLYGAEREDCSENNSFECEFYRDEWVKIASFYDRAIIASLLTHGPSAEVKRLSEQSGVPHLLYRDGKLLRRLFIQCLAAEERALRAQGLVKVKSIIDTPLAPGQLCFRKGYPEFRTDKAAIS